MRFEKFLSEIYMTKMKYLNVIVALGSLRYLQIPLYIVNSISHISAVQTVPARMRCRYAPKCIDDQLRARGKSVRGQNRIFIIYADRMPVVSLWVGIRALNLHDTPRRVGIKIKISNSLIIFLLK